MASYKLLKEEGTLSLPTCSLRIDGGHVCDVESAHHKINPPSPRMKSNGVNAPSSPRLVSLDVFRGLTVVVNPLRLPCSATFYVLVVNYQNMMNC